MNQIDRLIEAIDTAEALLAEEQGQNLLASLSSSLHEVYMNFGLFDSLTLDKKRLPTNVIGPEDESENKDEILDEGLLWTQEEEDSLQASWSDFDSSWESTTKKSVPGPLQQQGSARRGVRGKKSNEIKMIPTKRHDGPSSAETCTRRRVSSLPPCRL